MIKLLLADDEPLVLIGLQSMLKWEDFDIKICGTAHNGEQALDMIEKLSPDIVIADIKMPVKNGLEVLKFSREKYGALPVFIMLTNYEEFSFVKEAINCQALDYLVKMEVTPQVLGDAITKALNLIHSLKKSEHTYSPYEEGSVIEAFYEKFFICLFNNLFDSREQFNIQRDELGLDFSFPAYAVCYCEISGINTENFSSEKLLILYSSTLQMVQETINKFVKCYITSLDMRHFNLTFCLSGDDTVGYDEQLKQVLGHTIKIIRNYFSVNLISSVGGIVNDPFNLSESYYTARHIFPLATVENSVVFYESEKNSCTGGNVFDITCYKESLTKIFKELDTSALREAITSIGASFCNSPQRQVQAMDAACNLLYMSISLLPDGEDILRQIFEDEADGYFSIYRKRSVEEIVEWMLRLQKGLCVILEARKKNYKNRTIENVQKYIESNLEKKLSLNEVAALFGFSPNYLSQLFTKYAGISFVEYITEVKMSAAKGMMAQGNVKIYEIADKLGFENAFYFSKVFKKVEGISPREYVQLKCQ